MFSEQKVLLIILTSTDWAVSESGQVASRMLRKTKEDIGEDIKLMISQGKIGH